jgi:beta-phosphoglucomutase
MKAALFDMDGTLLDNMPFHNKAWREIVESFGSAMSEEQIQRSFAGKKNEEIIPIFAGELSADDLARVADRKERLYRSLYTGQVKPHSGALELLAALRKKGIKLAIASAAPPENRAFVFASTTLRDAVDSVTGGNEAKRGKPAPDLFLLAAERLGVRGDECIVFEDAVLGVQAGVAAGAKVVGVTTVESDAHLRAAGAFMTIPDFTDLETLIRLFD